MDIQAYIKNGIVESYVLGLASPEEAAELETLKVQFPEVNHAIREFSLLLEEYALKNEIVPKRDIKAKIMAAIRNERLSANVISLPGTKSVSNISKRRYQMLRVVAAASIILFITSAGLNFYLYTRYDEKNELYQELLAEKNTLYSNFQIERTHLKEWQRVAELMASPGMEVIKMPGTVGKEQYHAVVVWNTKNKDVYIIPNKLPPPPSGKQFQLWALVDGKPVDVGVLNPECQGICKMKNIAKALAFAITLENQGGSPTPTLQQMFALGKV